MTAKGVAATRGLAAAGDDETRRLLATLPQRRRRFGLALIGSGVLLLAAQSLLEWVLPYDPTVVDALRGRLPEAWVAALADLGATGRAWVWAGVAGAGLVALAAPGRWVPWLAWPVGGWLGCVYVGVGGGMSALALLLLVGVASLGWQARRDGGLALLAGTALVTAGWDLWLASAPTLAVVSAVLLAMFAWIDHQHIRASDRRLLQALGEREALIRDLAARGKELAALQGARTRLLASISHDLRQPLQAVRLFAEALQSRAALDVAAADLLRQQMRAADDAVAMLDQFSEFSAIEHGMLASHPAVVDVREVLDGIAASLRALHPPGQLAVAVHGRKRLVHTDRTQLARLVQNLAGNAVRYSLGLRPGRPARVVLAVRPHGQDGRAGLAIDVVDNGRGIPAHQLQMIFQPYVQLERGGAVAADDDAARASRASREGRGLGLAIVRGLVAQLGLTLAPVRSTPGRGTRFRVLLPPALLELPTPPQRADGAAGPASPQAAASRPAAAAVRGRPLEGWLLAVLDDEAGPRAALKAALEGVGATVVEGGSLATLRARLDAEERFPDALLFDLDLGPGEPDGVASVLDLRSAWELAVPAVIVTGRIAALGTVPLPRHCLLLAKPLAMATLVGALHQLVPARRIA
jgi:signal transduction histidine kinase/CheY-like chemotaxis protein